MFKGGKFYPFDPKGPNSLITNSPTIRYANTSYSGDDISIYAPPLHTSLFTEESININLIKYNPQNAQNDIEAAYNEVRTSPVLPYRSDKYKVCMHSVFLPEDSIALFNWQDIIVPSDGSPEYAKYSITVEYRPINSLVIYNVTIPLEYVPYYQTDIIGIKRVFSIDQCLQSLNKAYKDAFADLIIQSAGPNVLTAKPPYFYMENNTSLISFLFDPSQQGIGIQSETNPLLYTEPTYSNQSFVRLSMNFNVHCWFADTFGSVIPPSINGQLVPKQNEPIYSYLRTFYRQEPGYIVSIPVLIPPITNVSFWKITQMNSTTDLFSDVVRILVVSNTINTRPLYTQFSSIEQIDTTNITSSMSSINILGDFAYTQSTYNNSEVSAPISYSSNPHNWLDIMTEEPLRLLSYRILVLRSNGVLSPVLLKPGKCCFLKLIFSLK